MSPDHPEAPVSVTIRFQRPDGDVMDVRINVPESAMEMPLDDPIVGQLKRLGLTVMHFNYDE